MADKKQLSLIKEGVKVWNEWRMENPNAIIDLSRADLSFADLKKVDLSEANLRGINFTDTDLSEANLYKANLSKAILSDAILQYAILSKANLKNAEAIRPFLLNADLVGANLSNSDFTEARFGYANLTGANLSNAKFIDANFFQTNCTGVDMRNSRLEDAEMVQVNFSGANLSGATLEKATLWCGNLQGTKLIKANLFRTILEEANMCGADLSEAILIGADLSKADLSGADLTGANLKHSSFVLTNIEQAVLTNCNIFGISAWGIQGTPKEQSNLMITSENEASITVDDLQVAQFIYLLLNNQNVRNVIDTITSKVVLILGNFKSERKEVLNAIREKLNTMNFTPIIFDFIKPASKDLTGTVETLARMARFIIADLTDPSSIPHELATLAPHLRTTPIQLLKLEGAKGYSMIEDYQRAYPWVLETYIYRDMLSLISDLTNVIRPAHEMAEELRNRI